MRVLLDTNVLIAGLISSGVCADVLEHCVRQHEPVTAMALLNELRSVLIRKFRLTPFEASQAVSLFRSKFQLVILTTFKERICRDPDDDMVIATALGGNCTCIITGDKDLLTLGKYKTIDIIAPASIWKYEEA